MEVQHGEIDDVYGEVVWRGDIGFVPASVTLAGTSWSLEFGMVDLPELEIPASVQVTVEKGHDAIWLFGRMRSLFGSWLELENDADKSILFLGFAAFFREENAWVPFIVTDTYLRARLMFGESLTDDSIKHRIATEFYELALSDPENVMDFTLRADHSGGGFVMVGGIADGTIQYDEEY